MKNLKIFAIVIWLQIGLYKTCKKMIPSIKLKDYLISLGYKIENRNDFMDACIKEQFRLLDKESRETVDEFPV